MHEVLFWADIFVMLLSFDISKFDVLIYGAYNVVSVWQHALKIVMTCQIGFLVNQLEVVLNIIGHHTSEGNNPG